MLLLFSLLVNFYLYFEYIFILEKVKLLDYQYQILEQNNNFLQFTLQSKLDFSLQFNTFVFYFIIIGFICIFLTTIYNNYEIIRLFKKIDNYQISNIDNNIQEVLTETYFLNRNY